MPWSGTGVKEEDLASSDESEHDWHALRDHREPQRRRRFYNSREDEDLFSMLRRNLTSPKQSSIETLVATLQAEGIMESCKLVMLSKDFLEQRFGERLTAGEVADLIQVWERLRASRAQSGQPTRHHKGISKGHSSKHTKGVASFCPRSRKRRGSELTRSRSRSRSPRLDRSLSQSRVQAWSRKAPPLFSAIRNGDGEAVRRLLKEGAGVHERHHGWTPLMVAAEVNNFSSCLLLLENRADVSATNRKGRCALSFAAAPSRDESKQEERVSAIEVLKLLLRLGANPVRVDVRGRNQHKVVLLGLIKTT